MPAYRDTARLLPTVDGGSVLVLERRPVAEPAATVVVCPSLFWDQVSNQRRELMLADVLAAQGVRCVRLQARGCGNAIDGSAAVPTMDSLEQDVDAVIRDVGGSAPLGIVGFRLSCLVALRLRRRHPEADLVLWELPVSGAQYLRECGHGERVARLSRKPLDAPEDEVESLHGERLTAETRSSLTQERVPDSLAGPGRVVVLSSDHSGELRPPAAETVASWRRSGLDVEVSVVPTRRKWWHVPDQDAPAEDDPDAQAVVARLAELLLTRVSAPVPS